MDIKGENFFVMAGSCLDRLKELRDNSVDSVVTDPPYELAFMGKKWDASGIAFNVEVWRECLRVLKPGGHLLAFGGTRTWHRLCVAVEDAGFDIRDSLAWLYGSGFPKSHNLKDGWDGWGTALKPAFEPIVFARKPLSEKTVAANVLTWGTGAINVDATRIEASDQEQLSKYRDRNQSSSQDGAVTYVGQKDVDLRCYKPTNGRWPSNVFLDETTAELLDEQSGSTSSPKSITSSTEFTGGLGNRGNRSPDNSYGDSGGASRFFYISKANKRDRNEGLEGLTKREFSDRTKQDHFATICGKHHQQRAVCGCPHVQTTQNFHPTVKPTDLMRELIKLVTPQGGTVLDPFTGSGSTGKAAILEGDKFIGVELTEEYFPIIQGRLTHATEQVIKEEGLF